MDRDQLVFYTLLRAGLWEKECQLLPFGEIHFAEVQRLAEEQSVVGLVAAGLEFVSDMKPQKKDVVQFIGKTIQIEQKNQAMNYFIEVLVDKMRTEGINTLLLKGQGVAWCYERPLWRSCGDVDFFLSEDNYYKAKDYLLLLANHVETERHDTLHLGLTIGSWVVELHGSLRCGLSKRIDKVLDEIMGEIVSGGKVRAWMNDKLEVFIPGADEDAIYIFTHILDHFYKGGIGLRQVCDWCRLLWTYRESIDIALLESRIRRMGLTTEWKAFGVFSVEYLGMPEDAMPLYEKKGKWKRKARTICEFVMEVGNFGHNRDNDYFGKPFLVRKAISFGRRSGDLLRHARIFPLDSLRFFPGMVSIGLRETLKKQ